jgi:hypothetical protein
MPIFIITKFFFKKFYFFFDCPVAGIFFSPSQTVTGAGGEADR